MEIKALRLPGAFEISLVPKEDERGYFMRCFDRDVFRANGFPADWKQENQSLSVRRGIIRGLHFQVPPHSEAKLVRTTVGSIWDVFVDLRRDSHTFGEWEALELSDTNHKMVYIPKGFAHGFCTLSERALVQYKVDAFYAPEAERGIRWNDEKLKIEWPLEDVFLSEKDRGLPRFEEMELAF